MAQLTTLAGPERRRRWSDEEQRRIVGEAFLPCAVVSAVARRFDVSTSLIYKWRRNGGIPKEQFAPVVLIEGAVAPVMSDGPAIVVDLRGGGRVRIGAGASASMITAALRALR